RSGAAIAASRSPARARSATTSTTGRWSGSMPALDLRIGIDVGGTNTDAVLLDRDDRLLGRAKVPTTVDVTGGIRQALTAVLASAAAPVDRISHVMLGTTHATN